MKTRRFPSCRPLFVRVSRLRRISISIALTLPLAVATAGDVKVTEIDHQGQPSYRITTPSATWIYHREGGGFASLLDSAGQDWISYRPTGGATGHYRGIPNAVFRSPKIGSSFFHPGHEGNKGSHTTLRSVTPDAVRLKSASIDGRWAGEWTVLADRAHFSMTKLPAEDANYWFLYEGTPGGRFAADDLCVRPEGEVSTLADAWEASTLDVPWVAFLSPSRGHALLILIHHPTDSRLSYRSMENAMTVFGIGRELKGLKNLLTEPLTITVAIRAETDPARIPALMAELAR